MKVHVFRNIAGYLEVQIAFSLATKIITRFFCDLFEIKESNGIHKVNAAGEIVTHFADHGINLKGVGAAMNACAVILVGSNVVIDCRRIGAAFFFAAAHGKNYQTDEKDVCSDGHFQKVMRRNNAMGKVTVIAFSCLLMLSDESEAVLNCG